MSVLFCRIFLPQAYNWINFLYFHMSRLETTLINSTNWKLKKRGYKYSFKFIFYNLSHYYLFYLFTVDKLIKISCVSFEHWTLTLLRSFSSFFIVKRIFYVSGKYEKDRCWHAWFLVPLFAVSSKLKVLLFVKTKVKTKRLRHENSRCV